MVDGLDLTRDHAEKIIQRATESVRTIYDKVQPPLELDEFGALTNLVDDEVLVDVPVGVIRDVLRDLGLLGMGMAYRYKKDEEYQTAIKTLARENVKLDMTIETLVEKLREQSDTIEE